MCRKLTIWDTKFRFCEGKVFRFNKRYKIWSRCDNLALTNGYIQLELRNKDGKRRKFNLHRLVYKAFKTDWNIFDNSMNNQIDHRDGNRSNNNIDNLRCVTNQKNQWNTNSKGYAYHKRDKKWRAQIKLNDKDIHLGCYNTETEAHNAYINIKKYLHNIDDTKYEKLTMNDLDYISSEKMKTKLLNLINSL